MPCRMTSFCMLLTCSCLGCLLLAGCTRGHESIKADPISRRDKEMSCEELKLAINDAAYVKQAAKRNRGFRARNVLWPFGYPATFVSAGQAIDSANERMEYLSRIYDIKNCDDRLYESR